MASIAFREPLHTGKASTVPSQPPDGGRGAPSTAAESAEENGDWTQITLRISKQDLVKIDASAKRLRITRAALFRVAALNYIQNNKTT